MTRTFVPRTWASDKEHPVEHFRALLDQLQPDDYPAGVVPAPVLLRSVGTRAFSAAAGLVMSPGAPLPPFPFGQIMFVAHNLTSVAEYERQQRRGPLDIGNPDHPRTRMWRHTYCLLDSAGISYRKAFFTNAFVGFKQFGGATGTFAGSRCPSFRAWCEKFLDEQIRVMKPRLVAVLGGDAQAELGCPPGIVDRTRAGVRLTMVGLAHPSAYRYYTRAGDGLIAREAPLLKEAYRQSAS